MAVEQREVYLLPFPFDSKAEDHLFIVLSVRQANEYENTFIAVMITSSEKYNDDFSFRLTDDMFDFPLLKKIPCKNAFITIVYGQRNCGKKTE